MREMILRRAQYWTDQGERVLPDTYHICALDDGAEVPLTRLLSGSVLLPDFLRRDPQAIGFCWRRKPVFCQMLGVWWLVGQRDPSQMAYPLRPLNARNLLAWAWRWTYLALLTWTGPLIGWLTIQGVLVIGELESFRFRHILTYLLRPGHRGQRVGYRWRRRSPHGFGLACPCGVLVSIPANGAARCRCGTLYQVHVGTMAAQGSVGADAPG